jgi:AraC family transcriptional regulator
MLEIGHSGAARLPQHSHVPAYLCLLLRGSYRETMGGRTLEYRPCTLAFHPPALTHRDEIGPHGGRFFNVEVDPAHIASLTDKDLVAEMTPGEVLDPVAVGLILSLYREYRLFHERGAAHALHVESISVELVAASVKARTPVECRRPGWLTRVIERLHDGCGDSPTVVGLARDAAVHPVHLARVFRRIYGCTMGQYRARIRVQRACRLLMSCDLTLARIAGEAGFADQSHLTRVFTSVVGCPPGMYRRLVG